MPEVQDSPPNAQELWRHSKTGNLYTILHIGVYCGEWYWSGVQGQENGEHDKGFPEGTELVVYVGHYNNKRGNRIYIRPLVEWQEIVKVPERSAGATHKNVPRFVRASRS